MSSSSPTCLKGAPIWTGFTVMVHSIMLLDLETKFSYNTVYLKTFMYTISELCSPYEYFVCGIDKYRPYFDL